MLLQWAEVQTSKVKYQCNVLKPTKEGTHNTNTY
jgi:hypothetical protein